jgi:long-chain acyl-CoA synthetase
MQLTQGLRRAVTINPGGTATIMNGRVHTWSHTADRIARLAARGIARGDRVAILALNSDRYYELLYAIPWLGAVTVPLNIRIAPTEIATILADSGARALFVDDAFTLVLAQLPDRAAVTAIYHLGNGTADMPGFESLLAESPHPDSTAGGEDIAGIYYTGGTTGRAKGVMLTHSNLVTNAAMIAAAWAYQHGSSYMHAAPMFHLTDGASTFAVTMQGCTHAFIPRFDPSHLLHELARLRITHCVLVPTMINALVNAFGRVAVALASIAAHDLSALRLVPYGCLAYARRRHGYGMSEASPVATIMPLDIEPTGERLQSCGRPGMLVDLRIADADDNEVPRGTVGEVQLRGPNIMKGY